MTDPTPGDALHSRFPGAEYLGVVEHYAGGTVTYRTPSGDTEHVCLGDVFVRAGPSPAPCASDAPRDAGGPAAVVTRKVVPSKPANQSECAA
jgi:hypothetical protein